MLKDYITTIDKNGYYKSRRGKVFKEEMGYKNAKELSKVIGI